MTEQSEPRHIVVIKDIVDVLNQHIALPDNGKMDFVATIEGVKVFVWNYAQWTPCSSASLENFPYVRTPERHFDFTEPCPIGWISLPFYLVDRFIASEDGYKFDEFIFRDKSNQLLKESFVYPDVSEDERMDALIASLNHHKYNVMRFNSKRVKHHYCEFSGGGDIYLWKNSISKPLIFSVPTDGDGDTTTTPDSPTTSGAQTHGAGLSSGDVNVSPVTSGLSKMSSLSVEGKTAYVDAEKLKFQLWANMISLMVTNFIKTIKQSAIHPHSQNVFTKDDIFKIKEFVGYGMACSGDGMVGVYKLEYKFGKYTSFVTKLELGRRDRIVSANLMDYTIKYYSDYIE